MAKPEWGVKRTCTSCGARFYDLRRDPIVCPKCEAVVDPLAMLRSQRSKAPAPAPAPAKKPALAKADSDDLEMDDDDLVDDDMDLDDDSDLEADSDDDGVMEDTSELGEDKDDMFEVIDKVGEEGGEEGAR